MTPVKLLILTFIWCVAYTRDTDTAQIDDTALVKEMASGSNDVRRSDDANPIEAVAAQQSQLIQEQKAELQALKADLNQVKTELQQFKAQSVASNQPIAFSVCLSATVDLTSDPRLHFNKVGLNVGQRYNVGTSAFVAPVSGLYVLSFKVMAGNTIRFGMFHEGTLIAETETADSDNFDRSFVQTLQHLTQGDSVWVQKFRGTDVTVVGGGVDTCFFGYLLHRD